MLYYDHIRSKVALMLLRSITLTAAFMLSISTPAFSERGVVVHSKSGCDYYIVETSSGYALLEWYGGNDPNEGQIIVGPIHSYGMKELYNVSSDRETKAYIDDYMLSKSSVIEKYYDHCD